MSSATLTISGASAPGTATRPSAASGSPDHARHWSRSAVTVVDRRAMPRNRPPALTWVRSQGSSGSPSSRRRAAYSSIGTPRLVRFERRPQRSDEPIEAALAGEGLHAFQHGAGDASPRRVGVHGDLQCTQRVGATVFEEIVDRPDHGLLPSRVGERFTLFDTRIERDHHASGETCTVFGEDGDAQIAPVAQHAGSGDDLSGEVSGHERSGVVGIWDRHRGPSDSRVGAERNGSHPRH